MWRGLNGASMLRADCGKIVIAVSEDIDPHNTDAVFWSLAYRAHMGDDLHVVPHRSAGHGPKTGRRADDATLLIDATLKTAMPPLALPARQYMERARAIWDELGLPPLTPESPWHGYSLGEWDPAWDRYADRAVSGHWAEIGERDLRPPPRRPHAGDAGARRRGQGREGVMGERGMLSLSGPQQLVDHVGIRTQRPLAQRDLQNSPSQSRPP